MDREKIITIYNAIIEDVRKDPNLNEIKTQHIEMVIEEYEALKMENVQYTLGSSSNNWNEIFCGDCGKELRSTEKA